MRKRAGVGVLGLLLTLLLMVGGRVAFGEGNQGQTQIPFVTTPVDSPARLTLVEPPQSIIPEAGEAVNTQAGFLGWLASHWGKVGLAFGVVVCFVMADTFVGIDNLRRVNWNWPFFADWFFNPFSKEYWRRRKFIRFGLLRFVWHIITGVFTGAWGLIKWAVRGAILRAGSPEYLMWSMETGQFVMALPGGLWNGIKQDWNTAFGKLDQVAFDPNMTDEELMEWAEASGGVVSDVALLWTGIGLAARGVSRARLFAALDKLAVERLGIRGGFRSVLAGFGVSDAEWWRVADEAARTKSMYEALEGLGRPELIPYFEGLQESGLLVNQGGKYTGRFSLNPWLLSSPDLRRVTGAMSNVEGAYREDLARADILERYKGKTPLFIWDMRSKNVATKGTDALVRLDGGEYIIVEVKSRSTRIVPSDLGKYLTVAPDGGLVFAWDAFLSELRTRGVSKVQIDEIIGAYHQGRLTLNIYGWSPAGISEVLTKTTITNNGVRINAMPHVR